MAAQISGKTQLTGLLGWPVSHSLSPAMQNAAAADLGLDIAYVPLAVHPDQLAAAVRGLVALGFRGANVTVPHKEAIMPLLDEVDPAAAAIGAVNTIVVSFQPSADSLQSPGNRSPMLSGYNTDWSGFLADLRALEVNVAGRDCLILGAGGSARAVAYGLASSGGRVHIFARRQAQAEQVVTGLAAHCPSGSLAIHEWSALERAPSNFPAAGLIVNTTPLGMTPQVEASPWPESVALPHGAVVYDLVYNPAETRLLRQARDAGLKCSNGLGMLLHQGAQAFKLWTGLDPDLAIMARAIRAE
jgi:shikimate dehydrogenase